MAEPRVNTRFGGIDLEFEFPLLDKSLSSTKVEHELLPETDDPEENTTVTQPLGRQAASMTLRGDCYRFEADELDELVGTEVTLRHPRFSGEVFVDDISTEPQGVRDGEGNRYTFVAELTEVL